MTALAERLRGGMLGLLVGDALGVPYEFHPPEHIPIAELIEMDPPAGFRRAHSTVPSGTWSDDGAHALCLLASLLHAGRLDADDLGRRFVNWLNVGYMAVDYEVFDVGRTTHDAIRELQAGTPADVAGPNDESSNGNGSLMRVLPLALWHTGSDEDLVRDARIQSRVTHGHLRSQLSCAVYCLWARAELRGESDPWSWAVQRSRGVFATGSAERAELDQHVLPPDPPTGGSGYVVDCLHSARASCSEGTYERIVRRAIALGHDTDTTACVAGGIGGIRHGSVGIPERWRNKLRGMDLVEPMIARLIEHRGI